MNPEIPKAFVPSLREIRDGVWEASIKLPVIGDTSIEAYTWEEAKLKLWLVSEAVAAFAAKPSKPISEWTEHEWRRILQKMREVYE